MGTTVIGSGAHVAVVATVDNARGICKAFIYNSIIAVQTNPTSHTLKPSSSHVESLRSV